jgi:PPM family protein phosphatase
MARVPSEGSSVTSAAALTHPGLVRTGNEDSLVMEPALALYAVADGMGGHNGGEIASRLVVETLTSFISASNHDASITWPFGFDMTQSLEANQLANAVQLANRQVRAQAQSQPELLGMGSTIIAVLLRPGRAWFANVGDSRLYLWRAGLLTQVSEDDSWAVSMVRAGASAESVRNHQMRHMLTKAVGSAATLAISVADLPLEPDDVLLLCSDGLHGPLGHDGVTAVLDSASADLQQTAAALIEAANAAGGPDNITAVLVRIDRTGDPHRTTKISIPAS